MTHFTLINVSDDLNTIVPYLLLTISLFKITNKKNNFIHIFYSNIVV